MGEHSTGLPMVADDFTELHAARLLLLLAVCGTNSAIDGLTKLAKLDFFVRYPDAFNRVAKHLKKNVTAATTSIESAMVRHHYGPWDHRYYQVLPFLEGRRLISIEPNENSYRFKLTPEGDQVAKTLRKSKEFTQLVEHMRRVKELLGQRKGNALKKLIYELFDEDVAQKELGEILR